METKGLTFHMILGTGARYFLELEGMITLGEPTFRGLAILLIVLNPKEMDDLGLLHWKAYDSMQNEAGKTVRG